ncbi:uncharacterized protein LOC124357534 [Homalodisca vitripennis]|uniref:uncharacterized protein LOC124357534 n=1 Tax=Homalodisca vitripennis TaxID=197043 RepID=UPI001EE9B117|nr:uncharacterized protein LOC124357534 [Homalodisca vitripennis]
MASKILFGVVALCLTNTLADSQSADTTVSDYIYWKKADIMQWHQYFPSWVLEEERQTNLAAVAAVSSLASSLNSSLSKIVEFQAQELLTAQQMVAGTDAEGCVNGISEYMTKAINDEVSTYNDCAADALSNLKRVNKTLSSLKTKYTTAYQKALVRIDVCAKTYPNKDSLDRLKSCVEAMNKMYFTVANATQKALFPSPSMTYFQSVVVGCASDAATAVATKGAQFLQELLDCSVLDSNIDRAAYAEELSQWQGYNDTLATQIATAQNKNYDQVWAVKNQTIVYYNLQKDVLEKYVIESRGLSFYLNKMYSYLSDYYNTVTATSIDNPGDAACLTSATSSLQLVVNTAASQSLSCDHDIVNNTRQMMNQVSGDFLRLNTLIPAIGNAAILNCIVKGYVYAPDTIDNCFTLVSLEFDIEHTDRNADITRNVNILNTYINSFFSGSDLPCGGTTLKAAYLAAEVTLYNLQRCLYITSGTVYSVTTPQPITTSGPITTPGQITTSQSNATSYW